MGRRAYRGADPFRFSLIFRTSAMTINNNQMQIKLSTTLKAEATEVAHVTVVIFPSVAREMKGRKSKPADLKILDAPGGSEGTLRSPAQRSSSVRNFTLPYDFELPKRNLRLCETGIMRPDLRRLIGPSQYVYNLMPSQQRRRLSLRRLSGSTDWITLAT